MTFPSKQVLVPWDGTAEMAATLPDAYIAGCLKRMAGRAWNGGGKEREAIMVAEARRRPSLANMAWAMNRLVPPACHCGRPGHYIVGRVTYCRTHKDEGASRLRQVNRTVREPRWAAREQAQKDQDQTLRRAEAHHKALGRGRTGFK